MCEVRDNCNNKNSFWASQPVIPQMLGPNGEYGKESAPAARSILACGVCLPKAIRDLRAIPFRTTQKLTVSIV